ALTDVAAEVLALRTELLRVNHRLAAVLNDGDRDLETLDRARGLAGRRSELNTRWERLSGLLGELRARRDRGCRRVMDRCGSGSRSWAPPRARGYRGEGGTP
ncbi:MAG TPA: hypothetical protein VKA41_06735, partial [Solirubrobacterales bacterium]|nr:hypothetical protein [Solirubrobacterales bacterium]